MRRGDKVLLQPGSKVPSELKDAVREHKPEIMELLARTWPPPDTEELLAAWEAIGSPEIPLTSGISVTDLRKWLYPNWPQDRPPEYLAAVRGFIYEGLPACEVPTEDPLLEVWPRNGN